jgi:hypothetical protein
LGNSEKVSDAGPTQDARRHQILFLSAMAYAAGANDKELSDRLTIRDITGDLKQRTDT